jgi:PLP dependent protein
MPTQAGAVSENLARIHERMTRAAKRSGRKAGEITLVAVSKTFSAEAILAAYDAGVRHFGESRIQEWESKRQKLTGLNATWHFIGHLQTNKVRRAVHLFNRVDSVDELGLAQKLNTVAGDEAKRVPVLIEVHLGSELTKSGIAESDLVPLAKRIKTLPHLELHGLMTVPPYFEEADDVRPYFRKLRELRAALSDSLASSLPVLSMGMSHDFEIAIEEGATEIRVGTALFGERFPHP